MKKYAWQVIVVIAAIWGGALGCYFFESKAFELASIFTAMFVCAVALSTTT